MANGADTKKFFVQRDGGGRVVITSKDNKTYIVMEKYPEIYLKTFLIIVTNYMNYHYLKFVIYA